MLYDIEHELVIEKSDQMETAETGRTAESEVPRDENMIDDEEVTKTTFT